MRDYSPIVVWLVLLAANLCADLLALFHMRESPPAEYRFVAYFALLSAQLSAVCVWSGLRRTANWWSRLAPVAAVIGVSIGIGMGAAELFMAFLPYFGLLAAALLILLWLFRRSRYWQQRTSVQMDWQFSIAQLLALMTTVALLSVAVRYSDLFETETGPAIELLAGSIVLSLTSVFIWSWSVHWLLRLASVLAMAFGLGLLFYLTDDRFMLIFATYHYIVQAVVLVTWLAWGQILPPKQSTDAAVNEQPASRAMR